jgi:hypothetical protein
VSLSKMSMAQEFLFLRDLSCRINVESRQLLRTMLRLLEEHDLRSSEGGDDHSIS